MLQGMYYSTVIHDSVKSVCIYGLTQALKFGLFTIGSTSYKGEGKPKTRNSRPTVTC